MKKSDTIGESIMQNQPNYQDKKEFELFLAKHKAYNNFMKEKLYPAEPSVTPYSWMLINTAKHRWIKAAFIWFTTKQGHEYWEDISDKWIKQCKGE